MQECHIEHAVVVLTAVHTLEKTGCHIAFCVLCLTCDYQFQLEGHFPLHMQLRCVKTSENCRIPYAFPFGWSTLNMNMLRKKVVSYAAGMGDAIKDLSQQ